MKMSYIALFSLLFFSQLMASVCTDITRRLYKLCSNCLHICQKIIVNEAKYIIFDTAKEMTLTELLSGKSINLVNYGQYIINSLVVTDYAYLEQQARDTLKFLNLPDFIVQEILVLDMKHPNNEKEETAAPTGMVLSREFGPWSVPYAILVDTEQNRDDQINFSLFHEVGHVKMRFDDFCGSKELNEVSADLYALAALDSHYKKRGSNLKDFIGNIESWAPNIKRPTEYLQLNELLYYAKQIHEVQEDNSQVDVQVLAQNIISDRKSENYKKQIDEEVLPLFQLLEN